MCCGYSSKGLSTHNLLLWRNKKNTNWMPPSYLELWFIIIMLCIVILDFITDENRPLSRQGDIDRSRSRADYDRDAYYRDRKRGTEFIFT